MEIKKIGIGLITLLSKIGLKIGPKLLTVGLKLLKVGKVGLAIGSVVAYSYLFTWQFAVMIMVLLFVHESGHLYAMRRCGLKTKGIYFIPFLGAAAVTNETFKSRRDEVYIAIMGPIWGFLLSLAMAMIYFETSDAFFGAVAGWMALVNLFNLLPINPLDGGRILKSITFSINSNLGFIFLSIGITIMMFIIVWARVLLFLLLLAVGSLEFYVEYIHKDPNRVIKRSIKSIDKLSIEGTKYNKIDKDIRELIEEQMHDSQVREYVDKHLIIYTQKIKVMLLDQNKDPIKRIEDVISELKIVNNPEEINFHRAIISSLIIWDLKNVIFMPKMGTKGIITSFLVYTFVASILWALMSYMNNIPEVNTARQLFMGLL